MNSKLPTEPIVIGEFEKNSKDTVRVSLYQYHGVDLIDLRLFYKDAKDGVLKPGKGLSIQVDHYKKLAMILADAGKKLKELELL